MDEITSPSFWESRYQQGHPRWDLGQATPPFVSLLASEEAPAPGRTVVLGCGRGYDALLFARHGFETIGVDFAPSAIAAATAAAQATGIKAQFLQQDIFDLPSTFSSYFDYVVEHTCFCALPPAQRPHYVQLVKSLLKPNGELIGVFFTHNRPGGPPFGIQSEQIRQLFAGEFEILSLVPVTNSVPSRQGEEHLGRFRLKSSS